MTDLKTVVLHNGEIIHYGDWDYGYAEEMEEDGSVQQIATKPLPNNATIEQREMVYSVDKGWQLANTLQTPSQEDVLTAKIQTETINLLLDLGLL